MILNTNLVPHIARRGIVGLCRGLGGFILITIAVLCVGAAAFTSHPRFSSVAAAPASADPVIVAAVPTDGVIAFTIPRGATDVQQAGGRAYIMPMAMRFEVGDRLI